MKTSIKNKKIVKFIERTINILLKEKSIKKNHMEVKISLSLTRCSWRIVDRKGKKIHMAKIDDKMLLIVYPYG